MATTAAAPTYVFVLCPPYSGSTVLWRLLASSPAVSSLPDEGQFLPEVAEAMRAAPWQEQPPLPWARIKQVWDGYWDPTRPLWVEKSPPNLIRTDAIRAHFQPLRFLVMVRNPYAHCEGLMRRNGWDARRAAEFSLRCLARQAENARSLPAALAFTYEDLVGDPDAICRRIEAFLPAIGRLDPAQSFAVDSAQGRVEHGIVDLNAGKIGRLSALEIEQISCVLAPRADVLADWGYRLHRPDSPTAGV